MPRINVLPKSIAELIAAGEVVERPASVVKETIENSIDAGASHITVEIQRGGITYIRVTDDGCGIASEDVPLAFLRHATSKIKAAHDLDSIYTLGFRGEALAAAAAVSRVELFTKTQEETLGTHYKIEGGTEVLSEETGCPDGTTLIIRDLFYNTPARMKFLKKDVTEGTAVAAVVEREALAHPEIAFKLIRDGKQTLSTSGDGKLEAAIYSVLGRDFSKTLIPVNTENSGVTVSGFVCKPVFCRASRSHQFTFLNGRYVHSGTVMAAVEQAYKNSSMVGKFPAFVLNVNIPVETVDVNVHPAKTQIRFSDERRVFDAVHYAVKNALLSGDTRPEINLGTPKKQTFLHMTTEQYRQTAVNLTDSKKVAAAQKLYENLPVKTAVQQTEEPVRLQSESQVFCAHEPSKESPNVVKQVENIVSEEKEQKITAEVKTEEKTQNTTSEYNPQEEVRLIGEAFSTYIIVQKGKSVFLIDKHAAHERIIFNKLKSSEIIETQPLLSPVAVKLGEEEYSAAITNESLLLSAGFEIEDFGNETVLVRAVPAALTNEDITALISEAAESLAKRGSVELQLLDNIFHTVACKAAIKAGYVTSRQELLSLAERVLSSSEVMYCPHGRPIAFEIKKNDLEKHFGRIQ